MGTIDYARGRRSERIRMRFTGPPEAPISVRTDHPWLRAEIVGRGQLALSVQSSKGQRAPVDGGPERHQGFVTVKCAGVEANVQVTWHVRVIPTLTSQPEALSYGTVSAGSEAVKRVRLVHRGEGRLNPRIWNSYPWVHTSVDRDELVIAVTPATHGPFSASIVVHSGPATTTIRLSGNATE
jgi:hypothetical protein